MKNEIRNLEVSLEKAKEWYKSDNLALQELALTAFTKEELKEFKFGDVVKIIFPGSSYERDYIIAIFPDKELLHRTEPNFFDIANITLSGYVTLGPCAYRPECTVALASEKEKEELLTKLAHSYNLTFDFETNQLVNWYPEVHQYYYFIDDTLQIRYCENTGTYSDMLRIEANNCFISEEMCNDKLKEIKDVFQKNIYIDEE